MLFTRKFVCSPDFGGGLSRYPDDTSWQQRKPGTGSNAIALSRPHKGFAHGIPLAVESRACPGLGLCRYGTGSGRSHSVVGRELPGGCATVVDPFRTYATKQGRITRITQISRSSHGLRGEGFDDPLQMASHLLAWSAICCFRCNPWLDLLIPEALSSNVRPSASSD